MAAAISAVGASAALDSANRAGASDDVHGSDAQPNDSSTADSFETGRQSVDTLREAASAANDAAGGPATIAQNGTTDVRIAGMSLGAKVATTAPTSVRPLAGSGPLGSNPLGGTRRNGATNGASSLEVRRTVLPGRDPATLTGLHPNAVYEFPGSYKYVTDAHGRVSEIHASLTPVAGERSEAVQRSAGGLQRLSTDEGGHLIAVRFNGPAHEANHIAQDVKLNRGAWRALENQWGKELDQGKRVDVQMKLTYPKDSQRPSKIKVESQVDSGESETNIFWNEARS